MIINKRDVELTNSTSLIMKLREELLNYINCFIFVTSGSAKVPTTI